MDEKSPVERNDIFSGAFGMIYRRYTRRQPAQRSPWILHTACRANIGVCLLSVLCEYCSLLFVEQTDKLFCGAHRRGRKPYTVLCCGLTLNWMWSAFGQENHFCHLLHKRPDFELRLCTVSHKAVRSAVTG